jgi:flagellin-like hook-associated protein FlgL
LTTNGTITSNVIPSGIWDFNFYVSSSGTNPQLDIYANVFYVYSSTKTIIASGAVNFTQASYTTITLVNQSVYVPTTVLTDYTTTVIGVDVYVIAPTGNPSGKTVTLYTDGSDISHVHTMLPTSVGFITPSSANNIAFYSDTNTISGSSNVYLTNEGTSLTVTGNVNALNISNLQSNVVLLYSNASNTNSNVGFLYSNVSNIYSNLVNVWSNISNTNSNVGFLYSNVSNIYSNLVNVWSNINTSNTLIYSNISNTNSNVGLLYSNVSNVYSNLVNVWSNINVLKSNVIIGGAISDETSTLTTSNYTNIRAPFPFTISSAMVPLFWLNVLPTVTSNTVFDILKNGNTIYSVKPQIGSTTASNVSANGIPGTLIGSTNSVARYDLLTIDVDTVGSGTPAGAKFTIYCM